MYGVAELQHELDPLIPDCLRSMSNIPEVDLPLRLPRCCSSLPSRGDFALLDPQLPGEGGLPLLGRRYDLVELGDSSRGGKSTLGGSPLRVKFVAGTFGSLPRG